jgi:hypothetical protein
MKKIRMKIGLENWDRSKKGICDSLNKHAKKWSRRNLIFLLIGIIGYFTVPSVANYIVNAGGAGALLVHRMR